MKLETAIKQTKPFRNPYQRAGVNLIYTHNWMMGHMKAFFSRYGVTVKQYNILRILKGAGNPVSTSYIRERLLDRNSDVSRIVDRMDDKGWIDKQTCPRDKRLVDVCLNSHGSSLLENINGDMDIMDNIFSGLSKTEVEKLNELLDKIRINTNSL